MKKMARDNPPPKPLSARRLAEIISFFRCGMTAEDHWELDQEFRRLKEIESSVRRVVRHLKGEDWANLNERRAQLIDKKIGGSLEPHEESEYKALRLIAWHLVAIAHPRDFGPLDDMARRIRRLKKKIESKRNSENPAP